jgi:hypothetical protein
MSDDVNRFLQNAGAGRYPNASFEAIGTRYEGTIIGVPKVTSTQFGDRLLIDLENPSYKGGGITLWIKDGTMGQAVATAVGDAGLEEGGKFAIEFVSERDTGKGNPLKLYKAQYEPPVSKVDVTSIFGGGDA